MKDNKYKNSLKIEGSVLPDILRDFQKDLDEFDIELKKEDILDFEQALEFGCTPYQEDGNCEVIDLMNNYYKQYLSHKIHAKWDKKYRFNHDKDGNLVGIVLSYECQKISDQIDKRIEDYAKQRIDAFVKTKKLISIEDAKFAEKIAFYTGVVSGGILVGVLIVL